MKELITISINNARFFAFHGYYEEEKKMGNEFEVNVEVDVEPGSGTITGIKETVNYEILFEMLRVEMQQPRQLLETLAMEYAEKVHQRFPVIQRISFSIIKTDPPIYQFNGSVAVKYVKAYS